MSNPDEKDTVIGAPTDISVGPEDLEEAARDEDAKPEVNEDSAEVGELGGTEGTGGAG